MQNTVFFASALMVVVGIGVSLQSPINAALGRAVGSGLASATISFGIGFLALLLITILAGHGAGLARMGQAQAWMLIGGLFGALFVWSSLWSVPVLGILTMTILLVLGQVLAAMAIDHFGAFGLEVRTITWPRVLAAVLLAAGVVLSRF